jgi:hypothetical protein
MLRPTSVACTAAAGLLACVSLCGPTSAAGLQGQVESTATKSRPAILDRLADVVPALGACWKPPAGLERFERIEATARFALRRDGGLIAEPRVVFATADVAIRARELLTRSVVEAIAACTPLRMSAGLGGAIAGRPITIRFIYRGPRGKGA